VHSRECHPRVQREDCCKWPGLRIMDTGGMLWRVVTPEALPAEKCWKADRGANRRSRGKRQGRNEVGLEIPREWTRSERMRQRGPRTQERRDTISPQSPVLVAGTRPRLSSRGKPAVALGLSWCPRPIGWSGRGKRASSAPTLPRGCRWSGRKWPVCWRETGYRAVFGRQCGRGNSDMTVGNCCQSAVGTR